MTACRVVRGFSNRGRAQTQGAFLAANGRGNQSGAPEGTAGIELRLTKVILVRVARTAQSNPSVREGGDDRRRSSFDAESLLQQKLANPIAKITLEFDRAVRHGPSRAARPLQFLTQVREERRVARQVVHNADGLSAAPRFLDAQLRDDTYWHRLVGSALAAPAVSHRPAAAGAHPAGGSGVDHSCVLVGGHRAIMREVGRSRKCADGIWLRTSTCSLPGDSIVTWARENVSAVGTPVGREASRTSRLVRCVTVAPVVRRRAGCSSRPNAGGTCTAGYSSACGWS